MPAPKKSPKTAPRELRIEYMPIDSLKEFPGNPKDHDDSLIQDSFDEFGYVEPAVMDEGTKFVVAGHGRLQNLKARKKAGKEPPEGIQVGPDGAWTMPVVRGAKFRDRDQATRYLLASNQTTIRGGWNGKALTQMLVEFEEIELRGTGFTQQDVVMFTQRYGEAQGPTSFQRAGGDLATAYCCPRCKYSWSGNPKAGEDLGPPADNVTGKPA